MRNILIGWGLGVGPGGTSVGVWTVEDSDNLPRSDLKMAEFVNSVTYSVFALFVHQYREAICFAE